MNEFLLNVIAGVIASWIFCLISKIFAKVKSHSNGRIELYPLFYTVKTCKSSYKVLVQSLVLFLLY